MDFDRNDDIFVSGHTACAGCGAAIIIRTVMREMGDDMIIVNATGCSEIFTSCYPLSAFKVPYIHVTFENAAAVATGVVQALRAQGNEHTQVVVLAGDGATYDIGFGLVSGMFERNEDVLYICYDNEAYMNCLSTDALIMCKDGLKKITDLKVGDKVYAFDQKKHKIVYKKCTGIFDNGIKKTYEVKTLHHNLKATSNHPFLTVKRNGRGKETTLVWKKVKSLKKGDEIIVLKNIKEGKSHKFKKIKISKKGDYKVNKINKINIPSKSNPELMEMLGMYVGDGWVRTEKAETGLALPKNTKANKRFKRWSKKVFGYKIKQTEKNYIYIYSVNLARFIDSLGFGKGAKNKRIPEWVFTLPKKEKEAFVKGLLLSDGYTINKSNRYVSASMELLRTLRLLLQTMDYRVGKIHSQTKKKGTHVVYRKLLEDSNYGYICFSKKKNVNTKKYLSQAKQRNFFIDNNDFNAERIQEIKFVKEEPTLDLRVEGEHNFIANGIVVHNTGIQKSSSTPFGAWTTTSQVGDDIKGKQYPKKRIVDIAAAHDIPYAANSSIGYINDVIKKVKKAKEIKGSRFINILSPCVPGWKSKPQDSVELAKLAVDTGLWKMNEIEDGKETINIKPKFVPVEEYLMKQGRFKHLSEDMIKEIQNHVNKKWNKK